jgi:outer membrane protein OmpA-like peptidoglycan-associated protein
MFRMSTLGLCVTLLSALSVPALAQTADEINRIIRGLAPIAGQTVAGQSGATLTTPAPTTAPRNSGTHVGSSQTTVPSRSGVLLEVVRDQRVIVVDTTYALDFEVYFPFDSAELTPQARVELAALGRALSSRELQPYSYLVAGHTDAVGQPTYNQSLSERRAAAVVQYLFEAFPIAPDRLISVGFGQSRLKAPGDPRAAINRRVEVLLITAP